MGAKTLTWPNPSLPLSRSEDPRDDTECSQRRLARERLALALRKLGTFRVVHTDGALTVEHVGRVRGAVACSAAWVCVGALFASFAVAAEQGGQFAAAAGAVILGVVVLMWAVSWRCTRTRVVLSDDAAVQCLLLGTYGREPSVRRRRRGIVRRIHALRGAEMTVLPSIWDRALERVRCGA